MTTYKWSPAEISNLPYWKTYELEFGEWTKKSKEPVYHYADQLPF